MTSGTTLSRSPQSSIGHIEFSVMAEGHPDVHADAELTTHTMQWKYLFAPTVVP